MSIDSYDIIQSAEDFAETLRIRARAVVDAFDEMAKHPRGSANADFAAGTLGVVLRELDLASAEQFVRPGCEPGEDTGRPPYCTQGENCGGHHPWLQPDPS